MKVAGTAEGVAAPAGGEEAFYGMKLLRKLAYNLCSNLQKIFVIIGAMYMDWRHSNGVVHAQIPYDALGVHAGVDSPGLVCSQFLGLVANA